MTQYYVHITNAAERDINRAADYIEYSLKNPLTADTLLDDTEEALSIELNVQPAITELLHVPGNIHPWRG